MFRPVFRPFLKLTSQGTLFQKLALSSTVFLCFQLETVRSKQQRNSLSCSIPVMTTLRLAALRPLIEANPPVKALLTTTLDLTMPSGADLDLELPSAIPGRPTLPKLVRATELNQPSLRTPEGRASLIHSIVHIEMNAINLALDVVARFSGMPDRFYLDWAVIAKEEALHFTMLRSHLNSYGFDYGDFDAHDSLWDMAERTKNDILARIALVPRTLEARGLDASPQVKKKLVGAGDVKAGEILDIILRDEIGHVSVGNKWYRWLCTNRGLDPINTYAGLLQKYEPPKLRQPFNLEARRLAGFDENELRALQDHATM
jgi:uncharacterized ferritin-like protein (DUF455 family)